MNLAPRIILMSALGLAASACLNDGTVAEPGGSLTPNQPAPSASPNGQTPGTVTTATTPLPALPVPDPTQPTQPNGGDPTAPDPLPPDALIVHEWGTFTSVQDARGKSQPGLHHEDEELPAWVYRRNIDPVPAYYETLPEEPLQQLETPVVYFYAPEKRDVRFDVDFPEGIISQWYPEATSFAPEIWMMDAIAKGKMSWEVTVDPAIDPDTFIAVDPEEIWAPARNVASTPVVFPREGFEEREQFIFYRGLGSFDLPVRVTSQDDAAVHITNTSAEGIAAVFILNVTDEGGAVVALGPLGPGKTLDAAVPTELVGSATFVQDAQRALRTGIVATGLYGDEAQAMVETWTRSWFGNVGLRVLYLVPRAWTDRLLPIRVTPEPTELVRTLVGRIEVMTPGVEAAAWEQIRALGETPAWDALEATIDRMGRFAEPWTRQALEAHGTSAAGQQLLDAAHWRP